MINILKEYNNIMKYKILILGTIIFFNNLHASEIQIEYGEYSTSYNYFQKPNNDNNRIDLPQGNQTNYFRLRVNYKVKNDWSIYGLYAPLKKKYTVNVNKNFEYDGTQFNSGRTEVEYKFNSYRLGLLKTFYKESFKWWVGGTIKVRDAFINVTQGANSSNTFSNIGFVPLLSIGGEYMINDHMKVFSHLDGLAGLQGSAYDLNLELRYKIVESHLLSLGKRVLGGGADNDQLKNFAQFNSTYLSYIKEF